MEGADVLASWGAALAQAGVPLDPGTARGWLDLLGAGAEGRRELMGVVAIHARGLGEGGRPASHPVLQVALLDRLLPDVDLTRLLAIAADGHAIGAATRLDRRRRQFLRHRLPVLELPNGQILAVLVGSVDGELLDAVIGRAFVLAVGRGADTVILDFGGVEDLDEELLLATAEAFPAHELADRVTLVLSGLPDLEAWTRRLTARGAAQIRCIRDLDDLHNP